MLRDAQNQSKTLGGSCTKCFILHKAKNAKVQCYPEPKYPLMGSEEEWRDTLLNEVNSLLCTLGTTILCMSLLLHQLSRLCWCSGFDAQLCLGKLGTRLEP